MGIDNYETVPKLGVEETVRETTGINYMVSNPIEHYTAEEIRRMAELAKKNDLVLTIREERSNFYQGVLISLIKRSRLKEENYFIDIL